MIPKHNAFNENVYYTTIRLMQRTLQSEYINKRIEYFIKSLSQLSETSDPIYIFVYRYVYVCEY